MKNLIFILMLIISIGTSCKQSLLCDGGPSSPNKISNSCIPDFCLTNKIETFSQSTQICDTSASVKEYHFQQQNVYLFDEGPCIGDYTITVLNGDCDTLGYLGGIIGNTQINGVEFYPNATFNNTIWEN